MPTRTFRIFLSYASEDWKIALAIATSLREALGEFPEICLDKWVLEAGSEFKKQLEVKLEQTDVLIIVYTGVDKQSHSFTGWEVGYFEHIMKGSKTRPRRLIPLYLHQPPSSAAGYQGVSLAIPIEDLKLSIDDFKAKNNVDQDDPMCRLVMHLQGQVEMLKEKAGFSRALASEKKDPILCVQNIRLAVLGSLKTTVEALLKPQKQITIKSTGAALESSATDLPQDAKLIPVGSGSPMSIFGLADKELTWQQFLEQTSTPYKDSWRDAIASVILSSLPDKQLDVDNSQIVLSKDETKTYRVVLTTATHYWNDTREFNLYFVETLRREDYGDKKTSLLLKGLDLVCRYHCMFLEDDSEFSSGSILATREERLPEMARKLLRELNLMRSASLNSGLDQPNRWTHFVDWNKIREMGEAFRPKERQIRELLGQILKAGDNQDMFVALRQRLSEAIAQLEEATRPHNSVLIKAMANKLLDIIPATGREV